MVHYTYILQSTPTPRTPLALGKEDTIERLAPDGSSAHRRLDMLDESLAVLRQVVGRVCTVRQQWVAGKRGLVDVCSEPLLSGSSGLLDRSSAPDPAIGDALMKSTHGSRNRNCRPTMTDPRLST